MKSLISILFIVFGSSLYAQKIKTDNIYNDFENNYKAFIFNTPWILVDWEAKAKKRTLEIDLTRKTKVTYTFDSTFVLIKNLEEGQSYPAMISDMTESTLDYYVSTSLEQYRLRFIKVTPEYLVVNIYYASKKGIKGFKKKGYITDYKYCKTICLTRN